MSKSNWIVRCGSRSRGPAPSGGGPNPLPSSSNLSQVRPWIGKLLIAFFIMCGVTYYFFSPVFHGYTQTEVARARTSLYPWAYQPPEGVEPNVSDQSVLTYPWQVLLQGALESGDFPLWNPYSFAGQPFFSNGQNGFLYPPRLLLSLAATPTKVHDWLLISHMLLGGFTMFLLLSDVRLSFGASLFGGVAWMLNSFMFGWMTMECFISVEAWMPLAFLLMGRAVTRRSWSSTMWLGLVLALMFFGTQVLFIECAFTVIAGYGACVAWRESRVASQGLSRDSIRPIAGRLVALAAPFLIAIGLVAIQFIPTWVTGQAVDRSACTYDELVGFAVPPENLVTFFFLSGDSIDVNNTMMFLGTPAAILALVGFWRRHPLVAYSRVMGIVVLLVVTGTPLLWVFYKFMFGLGHLKPLGRLLFLFDFAVALLAAFGMDWVLDRLSRATRIIPREWWRRTLRMFVTATMIAIVVFQMYPVSMWLDKYERDSDESLYPTTPLIEALSKSKDSRMLPLDLAFFGATPVIFKVQSGGGRDSVVPVRIGKLWRAAQDATPNVAFERSPIWGFSTLFTIESAFDLFPRLGVTELVVPPIGPTESGIIPPVENLKEISPSEAALNPVIGDWDGDGFDAAGLCDLQTNTFNLWGLPSADDSPLTFQFGTIGQGWLPLVGDWDGDHIDTVGMYDPATSTFHLRNSNSSGLDDIVIQYGNPAHGLIPLAGAWSRAGADSVGLYDPKESVFHLRGGLGPGPTGETKLRCSIGFNFEHPGG